MRVSQLSRHIVTPRAAAANPYGGERVSFEIPIGFFGGSNEVAAKQS
jgi:hypothetical protein